MKKLVWVQLDFYGVEGCVLLSEKLPLKFQNVGRTRIQ